MAAFVKSGDEAGRAAPAGDSLRRRQSPTRGDASTVLVNLQRLAGNHAVAGFLDELGDRGSAGVARDGFPPLISGAVHHVDGMGRGWLMGTPTPGGTVHLQRSIQDLEHVAGMSLPDQTPESARNLQQRVASGVGSLATFGPRRCLVHLLQEVIAGGVPVPRSELVTRSNRYNHLVMARPDGYLIAASSGNPIQRAGAVSTGADGEMRAGPYAIGRFYYSQGGVMYAVDSALNRVGNPVGELGLEHDLPNRVLDGVADAAEGLAQGVVRLITHPVRTIGDLANLPGAVYQLIANSPEYWERFRAMPLGDQVQKISELVSTLVMMYGSAAGATTRLSGAASGLGDISVNVLRLQLDGSLTVARVAVPVGTVATAMSGGPGAVYVMSMANSASGGSSGGGGGGPATTPSGLPIDTPLNPGKMLGAAVKRCLTAAPADRLDLFGRFAAEIEQAARGAWTATRAAGTNGEHLFIGGAGRTVVIDTRGGLWVGDIANPSHFSLSISAQGPRWAPNFANLTAMR